MWFSTLLLLALVTLTRGITRPEDCSGAKQGGGSCVPIKTCESVIQMVSRAGKLQQDGNVSERNSIVGILRERVCGDAKDRRICCKDSLEKPAHRGSNQTNLETQTEKIKMAETETMIETVVEKEGVTGTIQETEMKKVIPTESEKLTETLTETVSKTEMNKEISTEYGTMTILETDMETKTTESEPTPEPEQTLPTESEPTPPEYDEDSKPMTPIGDFVNLYHYIGGSVFAMDKHTILIKGFTYDGQGPDAFLWGGNSTKPNHQTLADGFVNAVLPYPSEGRHFSYTDEHIPLLGAFYKPTDIVVKLPEEVSVEDLRWISVWCRKFQVNFGHVMFPEQFKLTETMIEKEGVTGTIQETEVKRVVPTESDKLTETVTETVSKIEMNNEISTESGTMSILETDMETKTTTESKPETTLATETEPTPPEYDEDSKPMTPIGDFVNLYHDIGGSVFAMDKHTIFIKGFTYDGMGPDAFLWGGNSTKPNHQTLADGFVNAVLPYPFEGRHFSFTDEDVPKLGAFYKPTDIVVKLPDEVSVEELRWISVWCRKFQVNFGHVMFPEKFKLN